MKRVLCIMLLSSLMIGEGKISGTGFFNYTSDLTDGVSGSDKSSFGFDRVYFTYKNSVSDNISFKFQTDVGRFDFVDEDDDGNAIVGGKSHLFAYIKKAQLDWKTPISKMPIWRNAIFMMPNSSKPDLRHAMRNTPTSLRRL